MKYNLKNTISIINYLHSLNIFELRNFFLLILSIFMIMMEWPKERNKNNNSITNKPLKWKLIKFFVYFKKLSPIDTFLVNLLLILTLISSKKSSSKWLKKCILNMENNNQKLCSLFSFSYKSTFWLILKLYNCQV